MAVLEVFPVVAAVLSRGDRARRGHLGGFSHLTRLYTGGDCAREAGDA